MVNIRYNFFRKSLVILLSMIICHMASTDLNISAEISMNCGLLDRQKKPVSSSLLGMIKSRSTLLYGISINIITYKNSFVLGGYIGIKHCNVNKSYIFKDIDSTLYQADRLRLESKKAEAIQKIISLDNTHTQLLSSFPSGLIVDMILLNDNKSVLHNRLGNLVSIGINLGYRINNRIYLNLGVGLAHFNSKYKFTDYDKIKQKVAEVAKKRFTFTPENTIASSPLFYNFLLTNPNYIVKKIKRNGIEIKGLIGFNLTKSIDFNTQVGYITGVKFLYFGMGVLYNF